MHYTHILCNGESERATGFVRWRKEHASEPQQRQRQHEDDRRGELQKNSVAPSE